MDQRSHPLPRGRWRPVVVGRRHRADPYRPPAHHLAARATSDPRARALRCPGNDGSKAAPSTPPAAAPPTAPKPTESPTAAASKPNSGISPKRFGNDAHPLTDAQGKAINVALRATMCPTA